VPEEPRNLQIKFSPHPQAFWDGEEPVAFFTNRTAAKEAIRTGASLERQGPADENGVPNLKAAQSELARMGRTARTEKQRNDPLLVLAKDTVVEAAKVNPEINDADLVREIDAGVKREKIKGRDPRTYGRWVKGWREDRILPQRPPRSRK
jgi:hypothetical protein